MSVLTPFYVQLKLAKIEQRDRASMQRAVARCGSLSRKTLTCCRDAHGCSFSRQLFWSAGSIVVFT